MCGIAGVIHPDPAVVRQALLAATHAQAHRGPDDQGTEVVPFGTGALGLGHRRLSILDLSALGHQPMGHVSSGSIIVFNGEIYNFRRLRQELEQSGDTFKSGSDTEILLAGLVRHGAEFLPRLEGMYALAFFDPRSAQLLLARDPAGIKPLYLAAIPGGWVCASEVRAILATGLVKPEIDRRGVAGFLAYGAVQHPFTLFEGVTSLPPGSHLTLRPGAAEGPKTFWRLPAPQPALSEAAAIRAVRDTLDAAVKDHLVADVPVGLFLSSGLDSTILAGLAARHTRALQSFTVVFADQPDFSEQALAAGTAKQFGLDHTEIALPMAAAEAAAGDWLAALDQPSIDGLNVFVISRAVHERGIKVALTGLGGDELFGGYPSFRDVPRLRRMMRLVRPLPAVVRRSLAGVATLGRPTSVRAKLRDMLGGDGSLRALYCQRRRAMSNRQLGQLGIDALDLGLGSDFLARDAAPDIDVDETDPVRAISQLEFRLYQGNMLLRDADANGMAFGLELRVPFLDQRLLGLAHAIPGNVRLPPGAPGKYLLRKAFGDLLRPEILHQAKRGFTLPLRRWMSGSLRPTCERALEALNGSRLLDASGVSGIWQGFLAEPESPMWSRALALVVLGEYVRRHVS
jgi:asparagine synthase (glutamine-hydrolysing)